MTPVDGTPRGGELHDFAERFRQAVRARGHRRDSSPRHGPAVRSRPARAGCGGDRPHAGGPWRSAAELPARIHAAHHGRANSVTAQAETRLL